MNKKEVIAFRKSIAPSTKEEIRERIKADGTIEGVMVRFYPGQQRDLRVAIEKENRGNKTRESIVTYPAGTDRFLSGDDDVVNIPCVLECQNDDEIIVTAENINSNYTYTLVCDVTIDYYGGKKRVIGGVI